MAEGVEERRSKRKRPCNGADRASVTRGYPTRKGADFRHGLNGREDVQSLGSLETLTLPGHFKLGLATSICPPTDVVRGGDGRSRRHRKRSRSLAGTVFGGARAQEAAELGTAVPARSAGPERAQEPAADGGQPGVVGP